MNKKIIIFDLDGTLLDTLDDLTDSANIVFHKFGYPLRTREEIKNFVGNGVAKLFERAGVNNPDCIEFFKKHYGQNMCNKTIPYDGILPLLNELNLRGIKIAVVSNKFDSAVKDLCKKYFNGLIDYSAGENETEGIKKKPSPDAVFAVLRKFKMNTDDAVYIGDSEVDIQTAKNAGMDCISVTWGFKSKEFLLQNGAKIVAQTPNEILKYL